LIISRTPFRISFFGGGTDLPSWYRENEGVVISTTIDKYCYINARIIPPFFKYKGFNYCWISHVLILINVFYYFNDLFRSTTKPPLDS